jgi:hypothetical protein
VKPTEVPSGAGSPELSMSTALTDEVPPVATIEGVAVTVIWETVVGLRKSDTRLKALSLLTVVCAVMFTTVWMFVMAVALN